MRIFKSAWPRGTVLFIVVLFLTAPKTHHARAFIFNFFFVFYINLQPFIDVLVMGDEGNINWDGMYMILVLSSYVWRADRALSS